MNLETSLAKSFPGSVSGGTELAHCPPFRLGPVEVVPAARQLRVAGGGALTIQPLAMRVLLALSQAQGETCSRDDLVRACWSQRIVGDDAVHRVISALRRDLARLSGGAVAIETIAKVGYRLRMDAERQETVGHGRVTASEAGKLANTWPAAALMIAGLASAGLFAATRASDVTAIAVVADVGVAGGETTRFADALTGDLARLASAMPSIAFVEPGGGWTQQRLLLRVALDAGEGPPTARVRLVDRNAGVVVWSREFDTQGGTLAEVRERVASGVAGVVQCGLDRSAAFDDPIGLRLYLGACDGMAMGDFSRARTFAQQITALRPDAPAGWACLAMSTVLSANEVEHVDRAVLDRAQSYAERALGLDPASGLAHQALALVRYHQGRPVLEVLEAGIRADPDYAGLQRSYAAALIGGGYVAEAVEPALRAVALHPHDVQMYQIAFAAPLIAGRTEEAATLNARMRQLWRHDPGVSWQADELLNHAEDPRAALATFEGRPHSPGPATDQVREALLWRADPGRYDFSRFDRMARRLYSQDRTKAWNLAYVAARMGDSERAHDWLARAPIGQSHLWWTMFAPETAALRRDPRFFDKMMQVGLVARWRRVGRWPDFCADAALPYDCRARAESLRRQTADKPANAGRGRTRI